MLYRFHRWIYWSVTPWGRRRRRRNDQQLAELRAKLTGGNR